jgi:DNA-binding GntR family transcriptional regulator
VSIKQPLATRQHQLIEAITRLRDANGYAPSQRELAAELGLCVTRINQLMHRCHADGLIVRRPRSARACGVISRS